MSEASASSHGALFLAHVHPADRFRVESLLESALHGEQPYVATYRWMRPDNLEQRYLHARAIVEADGTIFRGMLVDISSEVKGIQRDPDLISEVGNSCSLLGITGMVLDLEFTIRGSFDHDRSSLPTFGLPDADTARMQTGRSLPECFLSTPSQEHVHRILEQALDNPGKEFLVEWLNTRACVRSLLRDGIPTGIGIALVNVAYEQELARENRSLIMKLNQLAASPEHVSEISNLAQEIVGYSALIKREMCSSPIAQQAAEALMSAARALGEKTRALVTLHNTVDSTPQDHTQTSATSADSPPIPHPIVQILFSSQRSATCSTLPSLLESAEMASMACSLDEHEIRAHLLRHDFVRIVVLDVPHREARINPLIRSLRRLFPALHVVCLVPGPTENFHELRRAGAFLLLPKPVTPQQLEQVLRGLLELSAATSV